MTEFRAKTVSLLSRRTLKLLHDAGLEVVESRELAKCHAEIARLKFFLDAGHAEYKVLEAEYESLVNAT